MIDREKLDSYTLEVLRPRIRFAMEILQDAYDEIEILAMAAKGAPLGRKAQAMKRQTAQRSASVQEGLDALKQKPNPAKGHGRLVAAYWAKMTPEKRSAEMQRRQAVGRKNAKAAAKVAAKAHKTTPSVRMEGAA